MVERGARSEPDRVVCRSRRMWMVAAVRPCIMVGCLGPALLVGGA